MSRKPLMTGHCAFPASNITDPHARCLGGNRANPDKEWQPCPCECHLGETYECGCGRLIREAPLWRDFEGDEDMIYVHIEESGRAVGEHCT